MFTLTNFFFSGLPNLGAQIRCAQIRCAQIQYTTAQRDLKYPLIFEHKEILRCKLITFPMS